MALFRKSHLDAVTFWLQLVVLAFAALCQRMWVVRRRARNTQAAMQGGAPPGRAEDLQSASEGDTAGDSAAVVPPPGLSNASSEEGGAERGAALRAAVGSTRPGGDIRVAVIGGGIAGTSAAWALKQLARENPGCKGSRIQVTLFEERATLGGNAKTQTWPTQSADPANPLRTGLSVLGWPKAYFKNYEVLLERLDVRVCDVTPKFVVSADGNSPVFAHGQTKINARWRGDMRRWDRSVRFIRAVNSIFGRALPSFVQKFAPRWITHMICFTALPRQDKYPDGAAAAPSFYEVSYLNPMNLIPALWVVRGFGVSRDFWDLVVVPVYSSSFLTGVLDDMPACILPALDDIISVGSADPLKSIRTWTQDSTDVFDRMADDIGWRRIRLESRIGSAQVSEGPDQTKRLSFEDGTSLFFDYVVYACPASSVNRITGLCRRTRSTLFDLVLSNIRYETDRDRNFVHGDVHTDRAVIPSGAIEKLVRQSGFSNYVRVLNRETGSCCNVFSLGTWIPAALREAAARQKPVTRAPNRTASLDGSLNESGSDRSLNRSTRRPPPLMINNSQVFLSSSGCGQSAEPLDLYVSYDASRNCNLDVAGEKSFAPSIDAGMPQRHPAAAKKVGTVDNSFAHPVLSTKAMALSSALSLLQGVHGQYYCGSYATPGNGHDLSHLSGLAVAAALFEAVNGEDGRVDPVQYYAHRLHADAQAARDFVLLRQLMGL